MPKGIYKRTKYHKKRLSDSQKGRISGMLGKKHSEETKEKMSKIKRGKKPKNFYEMQKKGWENNKGKKTWNFGKTNIYSKETLKKMGKGRRNKPSSFLGKKHSEEAKKKMGLANLGKEPWNKGIKIDKLKYPKIGNWKDGCSRNLDYIRKMRQTEKEKIAGRKKPKWCEICGAGGKICFDHDHKTGKFRGWICFRCNLILGQCGDNPKIFIKLLNYLKKTK